jgi:uncharacterized protein (DUF305 family)
MSRGRGTARRRAAVHVAIVACATFGVATAAGAQGGVVGRDTVTAGYPRRPHTPADVHFISGMIHHHAQALAMSALAPARGAGKSVQTLAERIINAQTDEIALLQTWLRDRALPVPEARPGPMKVTMHGMEHDMLMPGMLTDEQMKQLDRARGVEFDRLFLTFMIRHHQGALTMVDTLFATPGAGQDVAVYKFASDTFADQGSEITRMRIMLLSLPPKSP